MSSICKCVSDRRHFELAAKALEAEARVCTFSGRGVVADCHGNRAEPMKMFYPPASRSLPVRFDFADEPDITVIALGTNDCGGGVENDEFKEAAKDFIKMVRCDSPNAEIIWIYGMMNERFVSVLHDLTEEMRIRDKKISFFPIEPVKKEKNELGALGHPNRIGQKRIAEELLKHIKQNIRKFQILSMTIIS